MTIYCTYHDWSACPMTDIDTQIMRGLASRIGGAYYGIHQTLAAESFRRDWFNSKQFAKTTPSVYSVRRDCNGRLIPPARCMADSELSTFNRL